MTLEKHHLTFLLELLKERKNITYLEFEKKWIEEIEKWIEEETT